MRHPMFYPGRPITSLQTMLRQISDVDARVSPVIPDGQYGGSTYASVRSFQHANSLPADGSTDLNTWNAVVDAFDRSIHSVQIPNLTPQWSSKQSVQPGAFNYHLYVVQAMLAALADFFPTLSPPPITGTLDATTQEGLKWVQTAGGIEATGALNTATWNDLNAIFRTVIGTGVRKKEA